MRGGEGYQIVGGYQIMRKVALAALLSSTALMLSGCAEVNLFGHLAKRSVVSIEGPHSPSPNFSSNAAANYKVGKPYQVKGVWYYPAEDFEYDETGLASWYGTEFHGKPTANGEVFDMNAVTAAHKTLQMPSMARVTNLENGRSVVLRINDRGPFVHGRIIDLSRRSAQLLGMEQKGVAKVRVQVLGDESRILAGKLNGDVAPQVAAAPRESVVAETLPPPGSTETARPVMVSSQATIRPDRQVAERAAEEVTLMPVATTGIFVQAGSFGRYDNALRLSARLSGLGQPTIQQASVGGQTVFRVRMGPLSTVEEADRLLDAVIASQVTQDARVVVD